MDKRRTKESQEALDIYLEIKDIREPFLRVYDVSHPQRVREGIRRNVRYKGSAQEITVTIKGNALFVGTRQERREERLADIVRSLLEFCTDEQLYEQALQLVEVR